MSGNETLFVLAVVVMALLLIRYWWNLYRYPLIACSRCHGSSMRTKWIFHPPSFWFRKVGGHCGRCKGKPWTPRRAS